MLADLVLELASAPGTGTVTLPGVAPQGRLTWASQFVVRSTVLYVLNDLTQEEWGFGTFIPGTPATLTRDVVLGNSAGTTAPLNFAGSTRCYSALPSAYLLSVLGKNVGRNLFHNPMFTVAQRGAGPFTPVGYTPGMLDRWQCEPGAAGSRTISQVALSDADRAAIGDEEASFALQYAVTGAAGVNDYDMLVQNIEFVRRTAGKAVTVSLWASASAAGLKVGIGCVQVFGGAGASGSVALNAVPQTLTTDGRATRRPSRSRMHRARYLPRHRTSSAFGFGCHLARTITGSPGISECSLAPSGSGECSARLARSPRRSKSLRLSMTSRIVCAIFRRTTACCAWPMRTAPARWCTRTSCFR